MIDNAQYLSSLDAIGRELQSILIAYNERANGVTDKATLIALRREQFELLEESIKKNRRVLKFLNGEPIEPIAHPVEAVLIGVLGGEAA